jgi:hypothetical protein
MLRSYEEFRLQFADRIHEHLFNGGALYVNPASPVYDPAHPNNNVPAARLATLADRVYDAIPAESARWGDQHVATPRTRDIDWQTELNYMLGTYFRDRHAIVLNQWRNAGLYPGTAAPELLLNGVRQHGGDAAAGALLAFENANAGSPGQVYYTTDGSDPRLVGGGVNAASAILYAGPLQLTRSTQINARILRNGEWSALTTTSFTVATPSADFDGDDIVDGADFLLWQRGFDNAGGAQPADGDADNDHDVDAIDLDFWAIQFGTSSAAEVQAEASQLAISDRISPSDAVMQTRRADWTYLVRSTDLSGVTAPTPVVRTELHCFPNAHAAARTATVRSGHARDLLVRGADRDGYFARLSLAAQDGGESQDELTDLTAASALGNSPSASARNLKKLPPLGL